MLEKIGHFIDEENQRLFTRYKLEGHDNQKISSMIAIDLNIENILKRSLRDADGGYVMAGLLGHGDAFVVRDPNGIRPCFYYHDDEIAVVTSERPAIQTGFNIPIRDIKELGRGNALIIKKNGKTSIKEILKPKLNKSCSFERIYFSRGSDADIYKERKMLGSLLIPQIEKSIKKDYSNTVFSFIPSSVFNMPLIKESIKLKHKAHQKPSTWKPLTSFSAKIIINALITNKNKPKVKSVIGIVRIVKIGFTIVFKKASTTATNMAEK